MRREWIEMTAPQEHLVYGFGLPPCGGSGLKYLSTYNICTIPWVSLHAEGVD